MSNNKLGYRKGRNAVPAQNQIGLGDMQPSGRALDSCLSCSFGVVPVIEEVTWTINLPLQDSELTATFGDEIDVLTNSKSVIGVDAVDSTFIVNSILQTDMLVLGFGIHGYAEPMTFSTIANAFTGSFTGNVPISPDVFTVQDATGGNYTGAFAPNANALGLATAGSLFPATVEWGGPAWTALWHLMNGYQFQWVTNQRELVIDELASDVAYYGPYAEAYASGTSEVAVDYYFARINERYQQKLASAGVALPITHRRFGSVPGGGANIQGPGANGLTGTAAYEGMGVFHPTRDFDLAPVTWGGLKNQGGCCQPFRRLTKPCFLERGIPIGMFLRVVDAVHQNLMYEAMSVDNNQESGSNIISVWGALAENNIGAPELSLTGPGTTSSLINIQQVNIERALFKGGIMKLAILLKGFEVPGPWKQWINSQCQTMMSQGQGSPLYVPAGGNTGPMTSMPGGPMQAPPPPGVSGFGR
jgi:hypothetical protein